MCEVNMLDSLAYLKPLSAVEIDSRSRAVSAIWSILLKILNCSKDLGLNGLRKAILILVTFMPLSRV